jgi:hypothetical protein
MSVERDFDEWLQAQKAKGLASIRLTAWHGPGVTCEKVLAELLQAEAHLAAHGTGKLPSPSQPST